MSTPQIHRVLAGPGSGKTRLLTEEIRNQLMQAVAAQAIVGITFTRRAAEELKARLQSGTSRNTPIPWVGTFHQLARRIQFELEQLPSSIDLDRLIPDATALLTTGARPPWAAGLRFIGVDEAQDLDEEQVEFLKALRAHSPSAALFLVGDPDQCLPPETPIATPNGSQSIETLRPGSIVLGTGGTPRLLPGQVRAVRETHWTGPLWVVRAGERILRGTPHHLVPVRFDPLPGLHYVYLMYRADRGYRVGVTRSVRSGDERRLEPGFRVRLTQEHGDKLWILQTCSSYVEARYHEALYAAQYGLPTVCFHGQGRDLRLDDDWIQKLYQELDTSSRAQHLLADLWIHPDFPHHLPQNGASRQSVSLIMFGDPASPVHHHVISWSSIRRDTIERRRAAGYSLSLKRGRYATFKAQRSHYAEALNLARNLATVGHLSLRRRLRIAGRLYDLMPLSHLHPGMRVLSQEADRLVEAPVEAVSREPYDGPVYDLEVDTLHTYTASGWLVHNSIYGFRDASPRFLLHPETYFAEPVRTIVLSENHRSAREIVETAQAILQHHAHPDAPCRHLIAARPEAHPAVREIIGSSPDDEAQRVFQEIRTLLAVGVPAHEQAVLTRTRAQFNALRREAARWRIPVYTPPLDERLNGAPARHPQHAVTLLTIHQAKGCEWTVVFLAGCQAGLIPHVAANTHKEREEERRLLYVAITRAKQLLWLCRHDAPCPFLLPLTNGAHTPHPEGRLHPAEHHGWLGRLRGWFSRQ